MSIKRLESKLEAAQRLSRASFHDPFRIEQLQHGKGKAAINPCEIGCKNIGSWSGKNPYIARGSRSSEAGFSTRDPTMQIPPQNEDGHLQGNLYQLY